MFLVNGTLPPDMEENRPLEALLLIHQNGALKRATGHTGTEDESSNTSHFVQLWVMVQTVFGFLCLQSMKSCPGRPFLTLNRPGSLRFPTQTQHMTVTVFSCELRHFMSLTKALKNSESDLSETGYPSFSFPLAQHTEITVV